MVHRTTDPTAKTMSVIGRHADIPNWKASLRGWGQEISTCGPAYSPLAHSVNVPPGSIQECHLRWISAIFIPNVRERLIHDFERQVDLFARDGQWRRDPPHTMRTADLVDVQAEVKTACR